MVGAILTLPDAPGLPPLVADLTRFWSILWVVCAAVIATLASPVIYGLREEIQQARRLGQYTLEEKLGDVRPSERLEAPVPPGLEQLILSCLEKDAGSRPADAAALRHALRNLGDVDTWDDETARDWWDRWRQRRKAEPGKKKDGGSVTMSIALDDRGVP